MQRSSTRLSLEHLSSNKRHMTVKGIAWHDSYYLSLFGLLFLAGLTMGVVLVQSGTSEYLVDRFSKLTGIVLNRQTSGHGFFNAFYYQCFPLLITMAVLYLCGFFALSQPVILFVPVFRGLGIGSCMGYLYAQYGGKGILYSAFVVFPGAIVGMVAMLYACREAWKYSIHCFSLLAFKQKSGAESWLSIQKYSARIFFFVIVSLLLLLLCTGISIGFLTFFSL